MGSTTLIAGEHHTDCWGEPHWFQRPHYVLPTELSLNPLQCPENLFQRLLQEYELMSRSLVGFSPCVTWWFSILDNDFKLRRAEGKSWKLTSLTSRATNASFFHILHPQIEPKLP